MKKRFKPLISTLFIITLCQCSIVEDSNMEPGMVREYISSSQDELMTRFRNNFEKARDNANSTKINWNEIYRVHNPENAITTYTLYKQGVSPNTFDNIIIVSKDNKQYSYTIRYAPSPDWINGKELLENLDDYTGYVSILSAENELLSELYYQNGVSEIAKEQNNARTEWCETVYEIHWTEANTPNGSVQGEEIIIYEWEVCYNDSDGAPTNTDNELDGGPSSGGGGLTPIGGGNPGVNDNDPIKKCPEGFKNENGSCISAEDFWEKQIDDSKLKPCMQAIMTDLKNLTKGAGQIVQKFSGSTPGYNWKTQHGTLPGSTNANTSQQYNSSTGTVTTTFDTNKFGQVSDLSVARTMLHESVHAYIVASFGSNYSSAQKKFSDFMKDFSSNKYPSRNDTDHAEFVRNYVSDIADALQEYGSNQGYSINRQFYEDLAWGGLTHWAKRDAQGNIVKDSSGNIIYEETSWFKSIYPNTSGRNRVLNTINTELGVTNTKQKGKNAGC